MLVLDDPDIVFLHIPRTGGIALSHHVSQENPRVRWGQTYVEHMSAHNAMELFPRHRMITILRNPWRIIESLYGWAHANRGNSDTNVDAREADRVCSKGFNEYAMECSCRRWNLRGDGGWTDTFAPDGVDMYRYEDSPHQEIAAMFGATRKIHRHNEGWLPAPCRWTEESRDHVASVFWRDISRGGYEFHGSMM